MCLAARNRERDAGEVGLPGVFLLRRPIRRLRDPTKAFVAVCGLCVGVKRERPSPHNRIAVVLGTTPVPARLREITATFFLCPRDTWAEKKGTVVDP